MKAKSLSMVAGILLVLCYVVFAVLAYIRYPVVYSPTANWLSDLGSRTLNPTGARFYNTGIFLTGVLTFLFFAGLTGTRIAGNRKQHVMVGLTQGFGLLGAFAIVMSGLFPIDLGSAHGFWSVALYIMTGTAFAFSVAAFSYYPSWPLWLRSSGVVVAIVDIMSGVFGDAYVMEWITVALFLFYVSAVSLRLRRI